MNPVSPAVRRVATLLALTLTASVATAQLRVATWNVTNYASGRVTEFQTAIYDSYEGRSFAPDVLIGQEFLSVAGVTNFRNLLNSAPNSPGDWASAPFIDGPGGSSSAFFYRTSRVQLIRTVNVHSGGGAPNHPRNIMRYDIWPIGYSSDGATLACYSTHMKAGTSTDDKDRRLVEAEYIRANAEALNADYHFLLGGDLNIQSSTEDAYQELIESQADNDGRFFDPIKTPGSWNNNCTYRFVHTQEPSTQMDDRYDQILVCGELIDGGGFEYIGNANIAYSTSTWNDANHSYRAWGNDGTRCNTVLRTIGNTMVGPVIAQAIIDAADGNGHIPVYMELRVPATIDSETVIDFGTVDQGSLAEATLTVTNTGDIIEWTTAGVADLDYSLSPSSGFSAPGGSFAEAPGGGSNFHTITMDTTTEGEKNGTVTIVSNAPEEPNRVVTLTGIVGEANPCTGDINGDNEVGFNDLNLLLAFYGTPSGATYQQGDIDGDEDVDFDDLNLLLSNYGTICN